MYLGGGLDKIFWIFTNRSLGKWSNLTSICFKRVAQLPTIGLIKDLEDPNQIFKITRLKNIDEICTGEM